MKRNQTLLVIACILLGGIVAEATPSTSPVFQGDLFQDDTTDDNQFTGDDSKQYWEISPGADRYQNEVYERPTTQTFTSHANGYGASQYFANLDIDTGQAGYDDQYMYVQIDLVGNYFTKDDGSSDYEGLKYAYGFRFSDDEDGRNGFLMCGTFADPYHQASWTTLKTEGFQDQNGDIGGLAGFGGLNVTKSDGDWQTDGYETQVSDEDSKLFIRMIGTDTVQLAMDYVALGLDTDYIESMAYLDMQAIKGDPQDPQNYFWNDKFTAAEAGNPYDPDQPQSVYELDTIRGTGDLIPEPGTLSLLAVTSGAYLVIRRRFIG